MNSITITVPWIPILAILGFVVGFLTIRATRQVMQIRSRRRAHSNACKIVRKAQEAQMKLSLFRHPWDVAYKKCRIESKSYSRLWIRKWIAEQKDLPLISPAAAHELTLQLTYSHCSNWTESLEILAPYFDTGEGEKIIDCDLERKLPKAWFEFWKEIKDYPSRRTLFLKKLANHPVFREPLTTEQAALLSRALGGQCKTSIGFYASDLASYVVMTGEDRDQSPGYVQNPVVMSHQDCWYGTAKSPL